MHLPSKLKQFLWLLNHRRLSTSSFLHSINILQSLLCMLCDLREEETCVHLFLLCRKLAPLWSELGITQQISSLGTSSQYLLHRMGDPRVSHVYREQNKLADVLAAVTITTTFVDTNTIMGNCIVEECRLRPTPVGLCLILVQLRKLYIHHLLVWLFL
ncbi:hypothetical protein R3W88_001543 [Solanum pinnatisectum]|uniref:Reverse transcriptase zinc-binding domain-containing protein n=1 Tax=Solanum pinnatisectum TaxID=50273 RepID=A0AAV9MIG7_9SOLN|nr:hypothetical protein R3W88_001543 [Solanum pinnatisectum]